MNNLPSEVIDIIYEYDGRVKKAYFDCVKELQYIAKQWTITVSILQGVVNLPPHSKVWLSKCQYFHYFMFDYFRKKRKFE